MAETKYGKYIITEIAPRVEAPWDPKFGPDELLAFLHLNENIIEGAFYLDTGFTLPPFAKKRHGKGHTHDYDEVLAFFSSDPKNPHELGAVAKVPLGDETHTVTKSCLIFIPGGLKHGPIFFERIDRPIIHFSCGAAKKYF